jgi:hypothetical protein
MTNNAIVSRKYPPIFSFFVGTQNDKYHLKITPWAWAWAWAYIKK